ncbi:MAG: hypothetical protein IJA78_04725 [Clostridia bacterium]|nr:hypothetical protein [Clostridia bacterium]
MAQIARTRRLRLLAELHETRDRAALAAHLRPFAQDTVILRGEFRRAEAVIDTEQRLFSFYGAATQVLDGGELMLPLPAPDFDAAAPYGLRHLLADTARLQATLQAILRASATARVSLLAPFVTTVQEIAALRYHIERAMRTLAARGLCFDEGIELGVCIQTPAAAIGSRALAEDADLVFADVGALARFALAAPPVEENRSLWRDARPLVRRMVELAVGNAHAVGRRAVLYGETVSEARELAHWLAMGADALAIPAEELPRVARRLRAGRD